MPENPRKAAALLLVGALILMVAFATSYVGAFHDPTPRQMPVALVGTAAQAQQLNALEGKPLDVRAVPDRETALRLLDDREVYGAYDASANRLYVASAANRAAATALELTVNRVLAAQERPAAQVQDVKPLGASDPNGTSLFYVVIAWVFGGYFAAVLLGMVAGNRSSSRNLAGLRVGALAAFAVVGSLLTLLVVRVGFDVLDGPFLALWAAGALIVFATAVASSGLQALAGMAGTALVILLFVILGNPAAGGAFARPLLPGFWGTVGGLLPPGAGVDLVRSVLFFDGARVLGPIVVLLGWALLGVIVRALARRPRDLPRGGGDRSRRRGRGRLDHAARPSPTPRGASAGGRSSSPCRRRGSAAAAATGARAASRRPGRCPSRRPPGRGPCTSCRAGSARPPGHPGGARRGCAAPPRPVAPRRAGTCGSSPRARPPRALRGRARRSGSAGCGGASAWARDRS